MSTGWMNTYKGKMTVCVGRGSMAQACIGIHLLRGCQRCHQMAQGHEAQVKRFCCLGSLPQPHPPRPSSPGLCWLPGPFLELSRGRSPSLPALAHSRHSVSPGAPSRHPRRQGCGTDQRLQEKSTSGLSSSQWPLQDSRPRRGRSSFVAGWQDSWVFVVALGGRVGKAEKQGLRLQSTSPPALSPSEEIFRGLVVLRGGDRKRL